MSSIPPATLDPTPPGRSVETAPSATMAEGPAFAQAVGFVGLFALVLGAFVVIATRATGNARIVPEGWGFIFLGVGIALMLYHAVTDGREEVRRTYGMVAVAFLVLAAAAALLPGPFKGTGEKAVGFYLLPWGLAAGFLALLFAVPFVRHETDELLRNIAVNALLVVGAGLCVGVLAYGLIKPDWLAGTGLALAVLGLGFLCAYLSQVDTDDGVGYTVASTLGAVGFAAIFYAFARTVFPTVLYEGPAILRKPDQKLDDWQVVGRGLVILASLGLVALGALGKFPTWLRATLAGVGLVCAAVFALASTKAVLTTAPQSFMVPGGLIIGGIGLAYLVVALGVCSDSQFVTLVRRELSAYFLSPIGYLVLGGMAVAQWYGYWEFINRLDRMSAGGRGIVPEPIVRFYIVALFPILALKLQVAALTMRLFAEEKKSGTLEVLFTAPVSEWIAVVSKFVATWVFFMICWLPAGLFLIVLKMEGATPFDYRPLLGFYVALGATGAAFLGMGMFLSSLAKDQIVAAVLTFLGMLLFLVAYFATDRNIGLGPTLVLFLNKLAYIELWLMALSGQLPIRDVLMWVSLAVFFVFLTIKVLEIRRWG